MDAAASKIFALLEKAISEDILRLMADFAPTTLSSTSDLVTANLHVF